jgi:hypothetical protein
MRTFGFMVLAALVGYAAGAAIGYGLISTFSSNRHDRSVEAAMTAVFVFGPVSALLAMLVTWFWWL